MTNRQWVAYDHIAGFTIGRDAACEVHLDSKFVSKRLARVERGADGWELEVLGSGQPVVLDLKELRTGQRARLGGTAQLRCAEFELVLEDTATAAAETSRGDRELDELQSTLHANVLMRLDLRHAGGTQLEPDADRVRQLNDIIDDLLHGEFKEQVFKSRLSDLLLKRAFHRRVMNRLSSDRRAQSLAGSDAGFGLNAAMEEAAETLAGRLARQFGVSTQSDPGQAEAAVEQRMGRAVSAINGEIPENVRFYIISQLLKKQLYDIIFGYGPLQDLLDLPSVSEIMVVHPGLIYIEKNGRVTRSDKTFISDEAAVSVIERIVAPVGRRIDRSQPLVDARLKDGSRVNAVIAPLAVKGPCITIRKFPTSRLGIEDLIRWRALPRSASVLLEACVKARFNLVVAGGTGSGKTTLLNVLSSMISPSERLVTIEDSAELRLQQEHVVTMETRPANAEGSGAYSIRDLVKNALRMRPDRIIVGECRGSEAIDMLQAMNTGHDGSMTTLHANSAGDVIPRLETMVLMGADLPLVAVRRQIAEAINLIVFTERLSSGRRMVTQVSEVLGLDPVKGEVQVRDILAIVGDGGDAELRPTGYMPSFLGKLVEQRLLDLAAWFRDEAREERNAS